MTWSTAIDPALCWRLCLALAHSLWQLPLVALVAWLFTQLPRVKRSLEATHAIYAGALAVSLLALPTTLAFLPSPVITAVGDKPKLADNASPVASVTPEVTIRHDAPREPEVLPAADGVAGPLASESRDRTLERWAPVVVIAYLLGLLAMLIRLTSGIARAHRLRSGAQLVTAGPAHAILQRLAREWSMRVVPTLGQVESLSTPVVIGLVRPMILFPASALTGLTAAEIEMILAHELAHVRRRDPWIHLAQRVAESLYFFNPAIWFLTRRLSLLREMCCDEVAIGADANTVPVARLQYVAALVRVVETSRPATAAGMAGVAATGGRPSEFRRRVARLLGEPLHEPLRLTRAGLVLVALATSLLVVVPLVAESQPAQAEENASEGQVAEAPAAEAPPKAPPSDLPEYYDHPITVSGRALDEQGEPIAGATIYLAAANQRRLAETTTDARGRYHFEEVDMPIQRAATHSGRDWGRFEVFGTAPGYALAWRPPMYFYPNKAPGFDTYIDDHGKEKQATLDGKGQIDVDLRFRQPTEIRGRIVDDQGQPLPNTLLSLRNCRLLAADADLMSDGNLESLNPRAVVPPEIKSRTTDAEGRFEFTGLPSGYQWSIDVRPPGHSSRSIAAVTGETAETTTSSETPLYKGDFEVVFPRPLTIKFHVVHADTGKPAVKVGVGATVTQAGFWETTDEKGMIEVPLAKGTYNVSVSPRYGTLYLRTRHKVQIDDNGDKAPIVLTLEPAAVLDVTVVDDDTGEPLEGVDFWLDQSHVDENGQLHQYKGVYGWRSWEVETRISQYTEPHTDKEGKMRVLVEPGTYRVGVGLKSMPPGYAGDRQGRLITWEPGEPLTMEFRLKKQGSPGR